ncbi:MAG: putative collagen-binding domain-containing protein, partial [Bacteroidota bacterium]
ENQGLLDNGDVGVQRRLYYRELIARFGHHLALNWNIGEENGKWANHPTPWQTTTQRLACAQFFYENDPYQHHVVIHNGQEFYDLLGPESKYTGISLQTNREDFGNVHREALRWRRLSQALDKVWAIAVDEPGDHRYSLVPDDVNPEHNNARQNALWGALMAGAWGIEWYFGYEHPHSDLTCQDWRTRDNMWDQSRYALDFFAQSGVPFWEMEPMDDATSDTNDYVMGKKDEAYVIYQKMGEKSGTTLNDINGDFEMSWYNPRTGAFAGEATSVSADGSLTIGAPPSEADMDWAILIKR